MQLRKEWDDWKLYQRLFYKDVKADNQYVKDLKRKLSLLPQDQEYYTIAAYGSLFNEDDIPRTLGKDYYSEIGKLSGYKRIFDVGDAESGSYFNIKKTDFTDEILVNLITVKYDKIPNYILREGYYEPVVVDCIDSEGKNIKAITVISDYNQPGLQPMLNYVHLCISGVKGLAGWEGVECMLDNTDVYSIKQAKYISLREWLNEVNLVNHMIQQNYRSR